MSISVILLVAGLIMLALAAAGCRVFQIISLRNTSFQLSISPETLSPQKEYFYAHRSEQLEWLEKWGYKTVYIKNSQKKRLAGYYFEANEPTDKTVLAIHGYRCDGGFEEYMYHIPMFLEKLQMNVLVVDNRAHHHSEGNYIGFGWMDRLDCLQWLDWLIEQYGPQQEIYLQGISMGAAAVLMTAGEQSLPEQVKGVIADCGFSSVSEELRYVMKQVMKLPTFPLLHIASLFNKLFAGFFFSEGDTRAAVQHIRIPVLFIHGDTDTFVPTSMVHQLYQACSAPKELYLVKGAAHADAYLSDTERYYQFVRSLVYGQTANKNLKEI